MSQTPLIIAWLLYFVVHSVLASKSCKRTVKNHYPGIFPRYRLLFNIFATVTLLIPFWIMFNHPGEMLWQWQGTMKWVMNIIALAGIVGFLISSRYYDGATFLGLRPNVSGHIGSADEPLVISPLHRYVRHPWYFFGLLLIWTRDMNSAWLVSCILMTAYFLIGSRLEEKKLINEFGSSYAEYCKRVSGIIPLPWRILSPEEADKIMHTNNGS